MNRLGFCYDYSPALTHASDYDYFVTDPDGQAHIMKKWREAKEAGTKFLAYLALYEIGRTDPYLGTNRKLLKEATNRGIKIIGTNKRWKSKIMDIANKKWHALFLELVADAASKGYDGIYYDTWDMYGDPNTDVGPKKRKKLKAANIEIVHLVREKFPNLEMMLNRGWDVAKLAAPYAQCLLVESVWHSHDGPVDDGETKDLVKQIQKVQSLGYTVNILDYIPSGDVVAAEHICTQATEVGCGCTVLQGSLTSPVVLAVAP